MLIDDICLFLGIHDGALRVSPFVVKLAPQLECYREEGRHVGSIHLLLPSMVWLIHPCCAYLATHCNNISLWVCIQHQNSGLPGTPSWLAGRFVMQACTATLQDSCLLSMEGVNVIVCRLCTVLCLVHAPHCRCIKPVVAEIIETEEVGLFRAEQRNQWFVICLNSNFPPEDIGRKFLTGPCAC